MNSKIKILILSLSLLVATGLTSCSDYLDVELLDQMTQTEVFSKRASTERYLAHIYSYVGMEYDYLDYVGGTNNNASVARSDESAFSWSNWIKYLTFNTGNWGPTTDYCHIWDYKYTGINQATVFMDNVDQCLDIPEQERKEMKAEARFLRAYFYFELVRQYGPVYVWGDQAPDATIRPESIDRMPLSTNASFITEEFDKAIADLPLRITDETKYGRITKGAAMAAKSRFLLYMASPLFNGCPLYTNLKNKDGENLFPTSADPTKWDDAAKAAKDLIDMNVYSLYEDKTETDPFQKAIKSYQGIMFDKWNSEIIWGVWAEGPNGNETGAFVYIIRACPSFVGGYGGFAPSLKLVDTYPMATSGRYPITGYNANGTPIVDAASGYVEDGFTEPYSHPIDSDKGTIRAHNSCVGRDARFYASILANGFYWINTYSVGKKLTTFYKGGTSPIDGSGPTKVGYLWRRMTDPKLQFSSGDYSGPKFGTICWPNYRLAEIYLNYAEACNEKTSRNESEALTYINKVRNRAGLNNLEVAYPEVVGNQSLLRELIRKERMVELAFEGQRYYDVRRWMIAEQEMNGPVYTRNMNATSYDASWVRTDQNYGSSRVFLPKHYFFPIHQNQLAEMKNITQNYGW